MKLFIKTFLLLFILLLLLLIASDLQAQGDVKVSQLTRTTSLADSTLFVIQVDSSTYYVWRTITGSSVKARALEYIYPILHFSGSYKLYSTGLGDTSVTNASIKTGAVTETKIADNAVTTSKISNGTIIAEDLAASSVTTSKILDGDVGLSDLSSAVIAYFGSAGTINNAADDSTLQQVFSPDTVIKVNENWMRRIIGQHNLFDYIGAYDTSTSWTNVFQAAINSVVGTGKILYVPGNYKYTLTNAGNNPYAGSHDYCLDLKTGGYTIQGGQGAILYLKDGQQTDASGALDIIVGKTMTNFEMNGLTIIGNTAGQTGWSGGYAQITSGCIVRVYGDNSYTLNKNLIFENLTLYDHWSNPIDVLSTDGLIYRNCKTWGVGEGFEAITCKNVLFDRLNVNDSTNVFVGDGVEISGCKNFTIQNCTVEENGAGAAFDLFGSQDGTLKNFYIENWANGISADTDLSGNTVNNVTVVDGTLKNIAGDGLYSSVGNLTYDNITVDSVGTTMFQIIASGTDKKATQVIKNSTFKRCAAGYLFGNRSLRLENCTFDSSYNYAVVIGRSFANAVPEIEIKGCTFSNGTGWGIYEDAQGDNTFAPQGTVSYNTFINNTTGDISKYDSSNVKYLFNQSTDEYTLAGSGIPYGISPANCKVANGGTLTTLGVGSENQILNIRFDGSVTVRDKDYYGSGDINLSGDINYSFINGDYLTVKYNLATAAWDEISRMAISSGGEFNNQSYFSSDYFGSNKLFNPNLENYLYAGASRFTVSDTGFSSLTQSWLFDNDYNDLGLIDATDTGKVYINLTAKSEYTSDGVAYTEGYVFIHFYNSIPASVTGDVFLKDSTVWTPMTNITDISNSTSYSLYRLTVPIRNYMQKMRVFIVAGASQISVTEIEYFAVRPEGDPLNSVVLKSQPNSHYRKSSWKDWNNTEKAYIDSNGNASFANVSLTQFSIPDGRVDLPTHDNCSLDSSITRLGKLDTLNYVFGIPDVADGSYSGSSAFTTVPITITMVRAVLRTTVDGTKDTAKCNIYFSTDISSGSPNTLWSTDKNVVDSTTGITYSSFDDATIPAYSWIWLQCNDEVGTVNQLNMTVFARKD